MTGPGKYDHACTAAREQTKAIGAILIVLDGAQGSGFSVQAPLEVTQQMPAFLRKLADAIEADNHLFTN